MNQLQRKRVFVRKILKNKIGTPKKGQKQTIADEVEFLSQICLGFHPNPRQSCPFIPLSFFHKLHSIVILPLSAK
jgi:hypothetical protein